MAIQDDLRRLMGMDSIFLSYAVPRAFSQFEAPRGRFASWFKGRLQQSADGNYIFRSISADGSITGFQLGQPIGPGALGAWTSAESPADGLSVAIPIFTAEAAPIQVAVVTLQQLLPQEMTN